MGIASVIPQLRTTDLAGSIRFYIEKVGFTLDFQYEDFYAGIRAGGQVFHLKLADEKDPSIDFVDRGGHFHLYFESDDAAADAEGVGPTRGRPRHGPARDPLGDARVRHQGRSGPYPLLRSTAEDRRWLGRLRS